MENGITRFFKSIIGSFRTSDVEIAQGLNAGYLREINQILGSLDETGARWSPESKIGKEINQKFYVSMGRFNDVGFKFNSKNIFSDLLSVMPVLIDNADYVNNALKDFKGSKIIANAVDYREVNLLRAVTHFSFITGFAMDLVDTISNLEYEHVHNLPFTATKPMINRLLDRMDLFAALLGTYTVPADVFKKEIESLSTDLVSEEVNERIQALSDERQDISDVDLDGFTGSPILSFRTWLMVGSVNKHAKLQSQVASLKLRINYYESLKNGSEKDAEIEETIMQLQERVNEADYEISKIEKSAGMR